MKQFLSLMMVLCCGYNLPAQITIDSLDMPVAGIIVRYKTTSQTGGTDYTLSGAGYNWDFSGLSSGGDAADTFVTVSSLPTTYNIIFNNPMDPQHRATVASPQAMPSIPMIDITEPYTFYKNNYYRFGIVGLGAKYNGFSIPAKFDHADVLLRFPLTFGSKDSSDAQLGIGIPNLGYYAEKRHRVNHVDGWGTLYLPTDTFEVIRVKSVIQYYDSIYIDSLGFGMGFDRIETEYKWYSDSSRMPVLQVIKRNQNTSVRYYDGTGYAALPESEEKNSPCLFPNPASDILWVNTTGFTATVVAKIYNIAGVCVKTLHLPCNSQQSLSVNEMPCGIFFMEMNDGKRSLTLRFAVGHQ